MLEKFGLWLFSQEERSPISYILTVFLIFCSIIVVFFMVRYYLFLRGIV